MRSKRALVGCAIVALAAGALVIGLLPSFWPVMSAQALIIGTWSVFIPAICAMSVGIVGHAAFDARQGRNQTFNSAPKLEATFRVRFVQEITYGGAEGARGNDGRNRVELKPSPTLTAGPAALSA